MTNLMNQFDALKGKQSYRDIIIMDSSGSMAGELWRTAVKAIADFRIDGLYMASLGHFLVFDPRAPNFPISAGIPNAAAAEKILKDIHGKHGHTRLNITYITDEDVEQSTAFLKTIKQHGGGLNVISIQRQKDVPGKSLPFVLAVQKMTGAPVQAVRLDYATIYDAIKDSLNGTLERTAEVSSISKPSRHDR